MGARLVFGKQGTEYDPAPLPYRDPDLPDRLRFGFYISGVSLALRFPMIFAGCLFLNATEPLNLPNGEENMLRQSYRQRVQLVTHESALLFCSIFALYCAAGVEVRSVALTLATQMTMSNPLPRISVQCSKPWMHYAELAMSA